MDQISPTANFDALGWSAEETAILIKMHNDNCSMGMIGNVVGKSRNAVAGQIFKLRKKGLLPPVTAGRLVSKRVNEAEVKRPPRIKKVPEMVVPPPVVHKVRYRMITSETAVVLVDLEPHHCRWPLGEPRNPDFRFCGCTRVNDKKPYCEKHTFIASRGSEAYREA